MIAALVVKTGLSFWWVRSFDVVGLVAATARSDCPLDGPAVHVPSSVEPARTVALAGCSSRCNRLRIRYSLFLASLIPMCCQCSHGDLQRWSVCWPVLAVDRAAFDLGPRFGMIEMAQIRTAGGAVLLRRVEPACILTGR